MSSISEDMKNKAMDRVHGLALEEDAMRSRGLGGPVKPLDGAALQEVDDAEMFAAGVRAAKRGDVLPANAHYMVVRGFKSVKGAA